MKKIIGVLCLLCCSGLVFSQDAGQVLAPWTLLDQFEQAYTLNDQLQVLLVARSMDGAKLMNQAMEGKPSGFLEARDAVFVADVSRMPSLIATVFAMPAMRKYNYRVLLDGQSRVVPRYPGADDKVLWLAMHDGKVVSQREFADPVALAAALQQVSE